MAPKSMKFWLANFMCLVYLIGGAWLFFHPDIFISEEMARWFSLALIAYALFRFWRIFS